MRRFEQFLMEKRVMEFVDYVNTLSESQAAEILEGLDDDTLDLIESVLSEGSRGQKKAGRTMAALRNQMVGYTDDPEQIKKDNELQAKHDNVIAGLRASGRSVRGALRGAETIRNKGHRTDFDAPTMKGAELQQYVDTMRQQRGKDKQKGEAQGYNQSSYRLHDDPRSPKLQSAVRQNDKDYGTPFSKTNRPARTDRRSQYRGESK